MHDASTRFIEQTPLGWGEPKLALVNPSNYAGGCSTLPPHLTSPTPVSNGLPLPLGLLFLPRQGAEGGQWFRRLASPCLPPHVLFPSVKSTARLCGFHAGTTVLPGLPFPILPQLPPSFLQGPPHRPPTRFLLVGIWVYSQCWGSCWWVMLLILLCNPDLIFPMPLSNGGVNAGQRLGTKPAINELLGRRTQAARVERVCICDCVCVPGLGGRGAIIC